MSATRDSTRAPGPIVGAFPDVRLGNAPQILYSSSLSELSVASAKHKHPSSLPEQVSSIHHHAIKEDLRVLLRELRVRNEAGMEHGGSSQKILRMLKLSGCSLEEDEIMELQSYTWDLRIEG